MSAVQIGDKIYASDPITGWGFYEESQSILQKCIENRDVKSATFYASDPKMIDKESCLKITSLFMMLQYSIVADFSPAIRVLVDKKLELNTSFDSFKKNMDMAKSYGDDYIIRLKDVLKNAIGDEKYNKIF
jgi:hypothetical protein